MNTMKINEKVFNIVFGLIFFFGLNLGVSALCMLFLDLSFCDCLIYSTINSTWMPYLIPALLNRIEFKKSLPLNYEKTRIRKKTP